MASSNTFGPTSNTITPVKRATQACDYCRRRKIRCMQKDKEFCKKCVSAGLPCTYKATVQRRGPSNTKVLSENQRNAQLAARFPPHMSFDGRPISSSVVRAQGLLSPGLVDSCLDFFFANIYPSTPVLQRQKAQEAVVNMDQCTEAYCLVVALCAYVIIQGNMTAPSSSEMSNMTLGHALLQESVRVRNSPESRENLTHMTVLTSWFYYRSYFSLAHKSTAWDYLREATTHARLLDMHVKDTYKHDPLDVSRKRVLYWLLFMAERTHALDKPSPFSLYPTIDRPSLDEVPSDRPIAVGLELLITLYETIDDTFINIWHGGHSHADLAWFTQLQTQLSEVVPQYIECTEAQAVEICITQQWLKIMAWQLSLYGKLVSCVTNDHCMTFVYPIEISRNLLNMTDQFSQQTMKVHGPELIRKLFDIAYCLADVVAVAVTDAFTLESHDYILRFLTLISILGGGQCRHLQLLHTKLSEVLPNLPLP